MQGEGEAGGASLPFVFTLFVAGEDVKGRSAVCALRRLCEVRFQGQCRLEVVDVRERPDLAEEARILATPTLLKRSPGPAQRIIGDLGDLNGFLAKIETP